MLRNATRQWVQQQFPVSGESLHGATRPHLVITRVVAEIQNIGLHQPQLKLRVAVVGDTGSGKSSFVRAVMGRRVHDRSEHAGFRGLDIYFAPGLQRGNALDAGTQLWPPAVPPSRAVVRSVAVAAASAGGAAAAPSVGAAGVGGMAPTPVPTAGMIAAARQNSRTLSSSGLITTVPRNVSDAVSKSQLRVDSAKVGRNPPRRARCVDQRRWYAPDRRVAVLASPSCGACLRYS